MLADRWLSWFLLLCVTALLLVGCFPDNAQKYLSKHSYVSSWLQAVGSLAAVWATFTIFQKSSKHNEEREREREEREKQRERKLEADAEALRLSIEKNKNLMGKVELLSDENLVRFRGEISYLISMYDKEIISQNRIENIDDSFKFFFSLSKDVIFSLDKDSFVKLVEIFGEPGIRLKLAVDIIKTSIHSINTIVESYNKALEVRGVNHFPNTAFQKSFERSHKLFCENMEVLNKEFYIFSKYLDGIDVDLPSPSPSAPS